MNYISIVNSFWDSATTNPLSTGQIALWFALAHINNKCSWIEWFQAPNQVLSVLTGLSRSGILRARNELKQRGLIDFKERGTKATLYKITIVNSVQDSKQKSTQNSVQDSTQDGVQNSNTLNKQETKTKKSITDVIPEKAGAFSDAKYAPDSFEMRCVDRIISSVLQDMPGAKVPSTLKDREKWADEIERMKRLDNRSKADIEKALEYALTDSFWKSNIRSTSKFREKFETLFLQSNRKNEKKSSTSANRFCNMGQQHDYDYDAMVWNMAQGMEEV